MSKSVRGSFKWWVGCVGVSLLGACSGAGDEGQSQANGAELAQEAQAIASKALAVRVSADQSVVSAQESATVTVTLSNVSRHPVKLLKWHTPADGLEEALFQVSRDGEPVDFVGPHYKRPAPSERDFITLAPGESLTRSVELSGLYDLSRTGNYSVRFELGSHLHGGFDAKLGLVKSNEVNLWIEGRANDPRSGEVTASLTSSVSFSGRCSIEQQATLMDALHAASAMADDSTAYLNGTPSGTARYTTWFGAFSTGGWDTAKSHFISIKDAFDTKALTLDCSCKKSYYAYVYPDKPYKIYVCNAFWSAPLTGTDSKGGTLIHEMSHFTVVAGTDDYAYGQTNAKNLAKTDPAKALFNADNHEYFAENTPYLQ